MISGILAFFQALPKLLELYKSISSAIAKLDLDKDIKEIQAVHDELEKAVTYKDRIAAASRLSSIIKRL